MSIEFNGSNSGILFNVLIGFCIPWSQADSDCGQLLSVHLHFLSVEKAAAFNGEVINLLQDQLPVALVNTQDSSNTMSTNIYRLHNMLLTAPTKSLHPAHDNHYISHQSTTSVALMREPFASKDDCNLTVTATVTILLGLVGSFDENDCFGQAMQLKTKKHSRFMLRRHICFHTTNVSK